MVIVNANSIFHWISKPVIRFACLDFWIFSVVIPLGALSQGQCFLHIWRSLPGYTRYLLKQDICQFVSWEQQQIKMHALFTAYQHYCRVFYASFWESPETLQSRLSAEQNSPQFTYGKYTLNLLCVVSSVAYDTLPCKLASYLEVCMYVHSWGQWGRLATG